MSVATREAPAEFHPLIRRWFAEAVGEPTDIQARAWPRIAAGENVLVSAPTGSGKTLTAFLWAIQQLLTGVWDPGKVRVLYVSPLRALNSDVRRNLKRPLAELMTRFHAADEPAPRIRAMTRSGDTPQNERQKMLRRPPEILITTPESLNIMLTSRGGRSLLGDLETVILDEIHAVAGSKRGTHLLTALERLVPLSGEFQRLALSATIHPLETIAEMVGGYELRATAGEWSYRPRKVEIVHSSATKVYEVRVKNPGAAEDEADKPVDDSSWGPLVRDFKRVIRGNRSTLLFADSRRLTEKVTRLINEGEVAELAYSHHGSLSREVRAVVEKRLKAGELKAIVATNSLELGIDVGALDEVILIRTPRSVASAIQRIGRAGHGVGEVSRGLFYPLGGRDFLDAAVVAASVLRQEIEAAKPPIAPLDVLAQVILSMVAAEPWQLDELYAVIRTSFPYRRLERRRFDLVIDMLAGRYADSRIRELRPRISIDRIDGVVRARPGVARILYMAGGTIADRGYYALRLQDSMAKIGELDEEFVWERSVGDSFTLGAQSWQIRKVTHNDVLVLPTGRGAALAPFWRADERDRDYFVSHRVAGFLAAIEDRLGEKDLGDELRRDHGFEPAAAAELLEFLRAQKAATKKLPGPRRMLVEHTGEELEGGREQVVLHTLWGGTVNRPLALALEAVWAERYSEVGPFEVFHDDDCLLLRLPKSFEARELLELVDPDQIELLLRRRLEDTGFFGARFRAAASTALLLPRAGFRHRTPLWLQRQRSKKLLDAVSAYGDFPIVVETWRTCLEDDLDLDNLKRLLRAVRDGEIELLEVRTAQPSPMVANLIWKTTNQAMYEDDAPLSRRAPGLRPDVLQELVFASHLRPRLGRALIEGFRRKAQRLHEGYAPGPGADLVDWIRERLLIPEAEWRELVAAVAEQSDVARDEVKESVATRAAWITLPGAATPSVVALDAIPRLVRAFGHDPDALEPAPVPDPGAPLPEETRENLRKLLDQPPGSSGQPSEGGRGRSPFAKGGDGGGFSESADAEAVEAAEDAADDEDLRWAAQADLVGEWLRYHGPVAPEVLEHTFGVDPGHLLGLLETLQETRRVVIDELTEGATAPEVCDAENLEILLRLLRTAGRPSFEALGPESLPLFLAAHQGLLERGAGIEALQETLETLFGYPAPARAWEADILPARLDPYYPSWLDSLFQQSEIVWFGAGNEKLSFAFATDLELFREPPEEPAEESAAEPADDAAALAELFPQPGARHTLAELAGRVGATAAQMSDEIWRHAWAGRVTNDGYAAVRKGIENKFQPLPPLAPPPAPRPGRRRRTGFDRWRSTRPDLGYWHLLEQETVARDALDEEELVKDRIRVLLQRYGLLFRELLLRELAPLRWARVFRTLRIMELSGEVLAGHFFRGIRGLQFLSHAAFRELRRGLPQDVVYWLSAADPASLCGVEVEGLKAELPPRLSGTYLTFHGTELVLVTKRRGRELDFRVGPDHPHVEDYFGVLKTLLTREFQPLSNLDVETINGEPATRSPYCAPLADHFRLIRETGSIKLWKRYG